ncbi:MAG: tetratricopeptide repeat protein [Nitrospirota bacterium]
MTKFVFFVILIFLFIISLLAFLNKGAVDLTVWEGVNFEIPVIALIIISAAVGILSMLVIVVIRDTRKYIDSWQVQRQHKKEAKIGESFAKGLNAFFASRYDEAEELFASVVEDDISHLDALLRLGDISFEKQEFTRATDFYLKAKELKPRNIEVLLSLVKVSEAQNEWQDALKYLDSILEIDDVNTKFLIRKRDIYEAQGNWDELMEVQQKIIKCKLSEEEEKEENRVLLGYKYEMGRHYNEAGDTEKAEKTLKAVLKADKDFTAAYLTLAEVHLGKGNTKEAESVLLKGYEETSSLVILAKLENYYITEGAPGTIIDLYRKAVQKDPKDLKHQFFLAKLYYRLEMIDHAFETVSNIDTSASSDLPDFHSLFGNIYQRRAQYENAISEFKKALKVERPIVVPFCCSTCDYNSRNWTGRCPECRGWNTFTLDLNEACKA